MKEDLIKLKRCIYAAQVTILCRLLKLAFLTLLAYRLDTIPNLFKPELNMFDVIDL